MRGHYICFLLEIGKIFFELSLLPLLICSSDVWLLLHLSKSLMILNQLQSSSVLAFDHKHTKLLNKKVHEKQVFYVHS